MAQDPLAKETMTREAAERAATWMGCSGAHRAGDSWFPCASHEELMTLIRRGSAGLRELQARKRKDARESAKKTRYPMLERAQRSRERKKRVIARYPTPKKGWEKLGERGVRGIDTIPAGLVSGKEMPHYLGYGWFESLKLF